MQCRSSAILAVVFLFPAVGLCRTWHVEKDGSGDYTVLQDALDMAVSGDTISVGPGRYDEWQTHGAGGSERKVYGFVDRGSMTIFGSGIETIIGPSAPWDPGQGYTHGFETSSTCAVLNVQHITLEHLTRGAVMSYGDSLVVAWCEFREMQTGIAAASRFLSVSNAEFHGTLADGYGILSYFQDRVVLDSCVSTSDSQGLVNHLQVEGPAEVDVAGCCFTGGSGGIGLSRGPHAYIYQCEFDGQTHFGIDIELLSPACTLRNCVFRTQRRALIGSIDPGNKWFVEHVVFESVSHSTLSAGYLEGGYFRDCELAAGEHGVVSNLSYPDKAFKIEPDKPTHFDMRNNWWGTAEADSIGKLIFDYGDDDRVPYIIDFEPYYNGPVANKRRSLGEIKSFFR